MAHLRGLGVRPNIEISIVADNWDAPGSVAAIKWSEDGRDFSINAVGSVFIGRGAQICCRHYTNPNGHWQAERWFDPKADTLADILAFLESPEGGS